MRGAIAIDEVRCDEVRAAISGEHEPRSAHDRIAPMHHARWFGIVALGVLLGCGSVGSPEIDAPPQGGCDPLGAFDPPRLLGLDPAGAPADPALSPDELTLYLTRDSSAGNRDLFVAARSRTTEPFGAPAAITSVNSSSNESTATVSSDGLTLLFQSARVTGQGDHLYVATRTSAIAAFGAPALVAGVASPVMTDDDTEPFITSDGQELWFISSRTGSLDIYRATKAGAGFANPVAVAELNSASSEEHVTLSADRLTVYFSSNRPGPGAQGGVDIYRARRTTTADGFGAPVLVTELSTTGNDNPRWLSADNCRLYLHSNIGGAFNIYVANRPGS
jgi:Tol biopolymer transport system component